MTLLGNWPMTSCYFVHCSSTAQRCFKIGMWVCIMLQMRVTWHALGFPKVLEYILYICMYIIRCVSYLWLGGCVCYLWLGYLQNRAVVKVTIHVKALAFALKST